MMHSSLAATRGGKDRVPTLTGWRRELVPAVLVVVPVEKVAELLQQQYVKPKDQKPPERRVLQSISSSARPRQQLLPSGTDASPAAASFQKYQGTTHPCTPEPSARPLTRPLHSAVPSSSSGQTQPKLFQRMFRCKALPELTGQDGGGRGRGQLLLQT